MPRQSTKNPQTINLASVPYAALKAEVTRREREADKLQRRLDVTQAALRDLGFQPSKTGLITGGSTTRPSAFKGAGKLILEYAVSGRKYTVADLALLLRSNGWTGQLQAIYTALNVGTARGHFKRVDKGVYQVRPR